MMALWQSLGAPLFWCKTPRTVLEWSAQSRRHTHFYLTTLTVRKVYKNVQHIVASLSRSFVDRPFNEKISPMTWRTHHSSTFQSRRVLRSSLWMAGLETSAVCKEIGGLFLAERACLLDRMTVASLGQDHTLWLRFFDLPGSWSAALLEIIISNKL